MRKILFAEDDTALANSMVKLMQREGLSIDLSRDIEELETFLFSNTAISANYDAIVLDRLLGSYDTKNCFPRIKSRWPNVPVLVLSTINTPLERAELIDLGADDYMGKPFSTQELMARLRALWRRGNTASEKYRVFGNTALDLHRRTISVGQKTEILPGKEFLLFKTLSDQPGRVFNRYQLLETVWGANAETETNVVEATLTHLRKRMAEVGSNLEIKNQRNSGYWLEA